MKKRISFALVVIASSFSAPVKTGIAPEQRKFAKNNFKNDVRFVTTHSSFNC